MRRRLVWISLAVNATLLWLVAAACSGLQADNGAWYDVVDGCLAGVEERVRATHPATGGFDQLGEPTADGDLVRVRWSFHVFAHDRVTEGSAACRFTREGSTVRITGLDVVENP